MLASGVGGRCEGSMQPKNAPTNIKEMRINDALGGKDEVSLETSACFPSKLRNVLD